MLCSIYWDANRKLEFPPELIRALDDAHDKNRPIMLCGDMNAHHEIWGSPICDSRGEAVLDLCTKYDLSILNDGDTPTYRRHLGTRSNFSEVTSHIDITIVSNSILQYFDEWRVSPHFTYSDHARILFKTTITSPPAKQGRNLRKADWSSYTTQVRNFMDSHDIPTKWNETTLESQIAILMAGIQQGLDSVAPLKNSKKKDKSRYDRPDLLAIVRKLRKYKNQKARGAWSDEKQEALAKKRKEYKKLLKQIDTEHWREFVTEQKDEKSAAKLMRTIRKPVHVPPTLLRANGTYTTSSAETAALLLDTHFPDNITAPDPYDEDLITDMTQREPTDLQDYSWITHERIKAAIATFSNFKAHGPDDIKPIMLKKLDYEEIERLKHIFTASIQFGYIPKDWRKSRTVFIPKPGKSDYSIPKSFRPISLTSFLFKTMERLVLWHLEESVFKDNPMHARQHAFRKDHSTELALTEVVDTIEKAILNKKTTMAIFLDIEGAFDNLNTEAAIRSMDRHGIPNEIQQWYGNYLRQRSSVVEYGHDTYQRMLTKGTPQGGVLSPILWNLAFDSLLHSFDNDVVNIYGYADDACLLASHKSPDFLAPIMQIAINKCLEWGRENGLNFSATKTVAMIFSKQLAPPNTRMQLYMGEKKLKYSEDTKYLGVILDRRLTWKKHVQTKLSQAKQLLYRMKNALGVTWGLDPKLIRWIYTGIVRPAITYGALVWAHTINKEWQKAHFKNLHGTILRMLGPVRKHTPIAAMELMVHLTPMHLFLQQEAAKAFLRLSDKMSNTWSGVGYRTKSIGHRFAVQEYCTSLNLPNLTWDQTDAYINLQRGYNIVEASFEKGLDHSEPGAIMCYTDGSKQEKDIRVPDPDPEALMDITKTIYGIGSGFVTYPHRQDDDKPQLIDERCFTHNEYNTVFQAEVSAIHQAAIHLRDKYKNDDPYKFIILTDNQSAVKALKSTWTTSTLLQNCIKALNELSLIAIVDIRWIKAHVNHRGNEHADMLAKTGASKTFPDVILHLDSEDVDIPAPTSYRNKIIYEGINEQWTEEWMDDPRYRQSKFFYRKPDKLKAYKMILSTKKQIGLMIQFLTGHGFLRRHINLLDIESGKDPPTPPECRLCNSHTETPIHLITECEVIRRQSLKIFRYCNAVVPPAWSIDRLNSFLNLTQISTLHEPDEDSDLSIHVESQIQSQTLQERTPRK